MANNSIQNNSSMQTAKAKLEKAFARLEIAIDDKVLSAEKTNELGAELVVLQKKIGELREKNKIASNRLDGTIHQIRKILGS